MRHSDFTADEQAMLAKIRDPGWRHFVADILANGPTLDRRAEMAAESRAAKRVKWQEAYEYDFKVLREALAGDFGQEPQAMAQSVSREQLKPGPGERREFREYLQGLGVGRK